MVSPCWELAFTLLDKLGTVHDGATVQAGN